MARQTWYVWSGEQWVECGSEYAAWCAAELFRRIGRTIVLVRDGIAVC